MASQSLVAALKRSCTLSLPRLRTLTAAPPPKFSRGFATRKTKWSPVVSDGCDFKHWLVVMEKPEGDPTKDEIIDSYIKTLATIVGSEEEARMKIYSVETRDYYAFGALVSEELSYKPKELPKVQWVLPDSYVHAKTKYYGGSRLKSASFLMLQVNDFLQQEATKKYEEVANKHDLTLVELALGFARDRPFMTSSIIGAISVDQLKEDIDAFLTTERPLPPQVMDDIEDIFKRYRDPASR